GRWMAVGYLDGKVRVWETGKSQERTIEAHAIQTIHIGFSPDSKLLTTASPEGSVRLWDPATGAQKAILEGHPKGAMWFSWSGDGKLLAVACADKMVKL